MEVPAALSSALAGRYIIERPLGVGGMATVWLAQDLRHSRSVALKLMRPGLAETLGPERFLREIQIAAGLSHPHILPLHDSGSAGGMLYYVMPYVAGESLRARLARDKQLPVEEALEIARILAGALTYAHAHGVIHRDIKPGNILFEAGHPILVDFGIARAVSVAGQEPLTVSGVAMGTPAYMSPEQASGREELDARSDIYSLACVVYEMLAGTPPFTGTTAAVVLARHLTDPVPSLRAVRAAIPVHVEEAILHALAKSPAGRFTTPAEFMDALSGSAPRGGWRRSAMPRLRGRRLLLGLVALGLAGVLALLVRVGLPLRSPGPTRIAVLLYDNLGAAEDGAFADGLAEEISYRLAGIPGLRIIGRQSVLRYKNAPKSPAEFGKELGVDYVLGGTMSFDRSVVGPARMRINSSLQRASDNSIVWNDKEEGVLGDVFGLQANIAERVLAALNISLGEQERRARQAIPTRNLAAYQEYLIGRSQIRLYSEARIRAGIGHFERAVSLDSTFALAYSGLANAWMAHPNFWNRLDSTKNLVPSASEAYRRAERAVRHALALDSTMIEAQFQLISLRQRSTLDFGHSTAELYALVARDPDNPDMHRALRAALSAQGRVEEALVQSRKTVELDPLSPLANTYLAVDLSATGRTTEAMEALRIAIEMSPSFGQAYMILGTLLLQTGQREAGADSVRRFLELRDYPPAGDSVVAAALAGRGSVPAALEVLDGFARAEWEPEPRLAGLYALLGDKERALNVLERAKARRMWDLFLQRLQPFYDSLRDEPRFKAIWVVAPRH
jgi:TolB-like protein